MPRFPSHQSVAIAIAVLVVTALGACSGTGETREPGADRTRVTYRCSDRQIIRVLYDYTTPSAPVARDFLPHCTHTAPILRCTSPSR